MDPLHIILLVGAGLIGGTLSAMIGGAAVFTFPALLAAGVPPVNAAACNMAAMIPCNFLAAISDRTQLPPLDRRFVALVFGSVIGAGLGAVLLLATSQQVFALLVPLLLGFATVLFAYAPKVTAWLRERARRRTGEELRVGTISLKTLLPVSIYGGYFGAGVGVILLALFSVGTAGDYRSANVVKNLVTSLNTVVAVVILISHGAVMWPQALTLMSGAIAGGIAGSFLARIIPRQVVRVMVIVVGALLTVLFARRIGLDFGSTSAPASAYCCWRSSRSERPAITARPTWSRTSSPASTPSSPRAS